MVKQFNKNFRLPQYIAIKSIKKESSNIITLFFEYKEIINIIKPGQFFLIYVFNYLAEDKTEWIPISISHIDIINNIIGISVKKRGETTTALYNHIINDKIGLLGPFGNGINVKNLFNYNNILFICGGIGIAPILPLFNILQNNTILYCMKTVKDLCFINQINKTTNYLYTFIDTEIKKEKDSMLNIAEEKISSKNYNLVITIGPELMMKKILDLCNKYSIDILASVERYMKCGRGICGQCVINDKCVCTDGPVFNKLELNKLTDLGKYYTSTCGERKPFIK